LHCTPQLVPLQVATPKAGVGHGVHIEPHVRTLEFDTHWVPHWWKPVAQVYWQAPLTHCGLVAPAGGVHVAHEAPHEVMDSARHWFPQRTKPGLHSKSHAGGPPGEALRHTDTALAGAWHGVHELPQVATSKFDTQSLPHWWKPVAQTKPQSFPSQVGVALGGVMHASQRWPHVSVAKFDTHWLPHRW
jgi:hypothetical protein